MEVMSRVSQAREAYKPLKRNVYRNPMVSQKKRVNIWTALVLSKLSYQCSTWSYVPVTQMGKFSAFYHQCLKDICVLTNQTFERTYLSVRTELHVLDPHSLLAIRRLGLYRRVCATQSP